MKSGPALVAAGTLVAALFRSRVPSPSAPGPAVVERGHYLTHDVAMCVQCHSPRDEKGEIVQGKEFSGARLPVDSPFPGPPWAMQAPNLRGLTGFSEEGVVRLLRDGIAHTGGRPQSPMPPFRMSREDASAIVAYLRSLD